MGGQIAGSLASLIPGYGQIISPLILTADQLIDKNKQSKEVAPTAPQMNMNPFGFAKGGFIGDKFKQFNVGPHGSGQDQTVNKQGIPDVTGEDAVQNKENTFNIKGKPFVMSDKLVNPNTGNTFNVDAKKVNEKYKQARFQTDQKNSLNREMADLAGLNEVMKQLIQPSKSLAHKYGSFIEPPKTGTIFDNQYQVADSERYNTINENAPYQDHMFNSPIPTTMTNDPQLPTIDTNYGTELKGQVPQYSGNMNPPKLTVKAPSIGSDVNYANLLGLGLKGAALGKSAVDAFGKPVHEQLVLPNYSQSDKYIREANIDYSQAKQDALGASNLNSNLNRSASGNFAQYAGRQSGNFGQLADNLSNIYQAQNNAQSQLNLSKANYEQGKAVDTANRQYQNQQNNFQNDANQRDFKRDFFSDLSQIGSSLNAYGETQKTIQNKQEIAKFNNNQYISYLNAKYPNLQVNPDIINKFLNNQLTLDEMFSYLPANVVNDLKQKKNGN